MSTDIVMFLLALLLCQCSCLQPKPHSSSTPFVDIPQAADECGRVMSHSHVHALSEKLGILRRVYVMGFVAAHLIKRRINRSDDNNTDGSLFHRFQQGPTRGRSKEVPCPQHIELIMPKEVADRGSCTIHQISRSCS